MEMRDRSGVAARGQALRRPGASRRNAAESDEKGPDARRRPKAAREAYSRRGSAGPCLGPADENSSVRQSRALRGIAAECATEADRPFSPSRSATTWHGTPCPAEISLSTCAVSEHDGTQREHRC